MPDQKPTLEYRAERRYRKRWAIGVAITVMVLAVLLFTGFVVSVYTNTTTTATAIGMTQDGKGVITANYHIRISHVPHWVRLLTLAALVIGVGWVLASRGRAKRRL